MTDEAQTSRPLASASSHETTPVISLPETGGARHDGLQLGKRLTEYFSVVTAASFALPILRTRPSSSVGG